MIVELICEAPLTLFRKIQSKAGKLALYVVEMDAYGGSVPAPCRALIKTRR
jgi:hypothetical protein